MIDLTTISPEQLIARGSYSTVRSAEEDRKKALAGMCQEIMRVTPLILKHGQSSGETHEAENHLDYVRRLVEQIEPELNMIKALGLQKAELKQAAWG